MVERPIRLIEINLKLGETLEIDFFHFNVEYVK